VSVINFLNPIEITLLTTGLVFFALFRLRRPKRFIGWCTFVLGGAILSLAVSEIAVEGMRIYYRQPPPDYSGPLVKAYWRGEISRLELDRPNVMLKLETQFPIQYGVVRTPQCGEREPIHQCINDKVTALRMTIAQLSQCKGKPSTGQVSDYFSEETDTAYLAFINTSGPVRAFEANPNITGRSDKEVCVEFEKVEKVPNGVLSTKEIGSKMSLGRTALSKKQRGFVKFSYENINKLSVSEGIPVVNCYDFRLSFLEKIMTAVYVDVKPKESIERCASNNLRDYFYYGNRGDHTK